MSTTVQNITRNLLTILENEGLTLHRGGDPASGRFPLAELFYSGEGFQYTHGERPGYGVVEFVIRIAVRETAGEEPIEGLQFWVHRIREVVTPSSLNTGGLSETRPVVRVDTKEVRVEHRDGGRAVRYHLAIRYRENP